MPHLTGTVMKNGPTLADLAVALATVPALALAASVAAVSLAVVWGRLRL